jgi:hypothetical protein
VSRNLERERARERARKAARMAWSRFVWERTHNVGGQRHLDGGGKKSRGVNAVIVRPDKRTKKAMNGEPYGRGNGASRKRRLPSKPRRWPRHNS